MLEQVMQESCEISIVVSLWDSDKAMTDLA